MNPNDTCSSNYRFLSKTAIVLLAVIMTAATAFPVFSATTRLPKLSLAPDNVTLVTSGSSKYPVYRWTSWDASDLMEDGFSSAADPQLAEDQQRQTELC